MDRVPQYLLAIYIAQHRGDPPVPSGEVAELLDRSAPATTEMCKRLAEEGLVVHEPYEGVTLTEAGAERAAAIHETYVTVSWFFRDVLDLEDHESEAMEVAGLVSPTVAERLAATLPVDGDAVDDADRGGPVDRSEHRSGDGSDRDEG